MGATKSPAAERMSKDRLLADPHSRAHGQPKKPSSTKFRMAQRKP